MSDRKRIPYLHTNFETIRTEGFLYVDKTRFIEQLENEETKCHFLIRPRKFGKTLFLSVLEYYYDIRFSDKFQQLFGDLYIGKTLNKKANKLFVVNFEFSGLDTSSINDFNISLLGKIKLATQSFFIDHKKFFPNYEEINLRIWDIEKSSHCLEIIFNAIKNYEVGSKAYVIIDEYDHFANDMIAEGKYLGEDIYKKTVWAGSQVRDFYETLKANSGNAIDKMFITGITPIMLDDLTSGFNISYNLSLKEKYNEILGFTKDEVEFILEKCGIDKSLINVDIEYMYDGYLFNENAENKLFNSTMIFNYLHELKDENGKIRNLVDKNLKTDYGRIRNLINQHDNKEKLRTLIENNSVQTELIDQFSIEEIYDNDNFFSLLFYMGLITIDNSNPNKIGFKIPNYSIKTIFWEYIKRILTEEHKGLSLDSSKYTDAIYRMAYENDYKPFFEYFNNYIVKYISNRDLQGTEEKDMKFLLLPIFFNSNYYFPISELENSEGYTDIYLKRSHLHPKSLSEWILELKYVKTIEIDNTKLIETKQNEAKKQLEKYKTSNLFKDRTDVRYLSIVFIGKKDYIIEEI